MNLRSVLTVSCSPAASLRAPCLVDTVARASLASVTAALIACAGLAGCADTSERPPAEAQLSLRRDGTSVAPASTLAFVVVGDGIPRPLEGRTGDPTRGKTLLAEHDSANCVLCHAIPQLGLRFAGTIGPSLETVGARFSAAQLRLRIADSTRLDPAATMPSYYRVDGLDRVAAQYRGQPILEAQQVEDVVAYLVDLK